MTNLNSRKRKVMEMIFDHIKRGKQFKLYVYPLLVLPEITGFEDGLREIIPFKLQELLNRCEILKDWKEKSLQVVSDTTKKGSSEEYFLTTWIFIEFTEYHIIQKWLNYWLALWSEINPKPSFGGEFFRRPNQIKSFEIEKVKQNPISRFFEGRLRQVGSRLVGLCLFHKEKTPSFTIYPNNTYHCFGCQAHGDVIEFIQKTKKLSFPEAVRFLS